MDGLIVYDLKDLEQKLKIGRRTLREYIKGGTLEAKKVGRHYLITEPQLRAFLKLSGDKPSDNDMVERMKKRMLESDAIDSPYDPDTFERLESRDRSRRNRG